MSYLVIFCSCVFQSFSIAINSLGKRELILVLFIRLFDLRLFGFICFRAVCDCGTSKTFLLPLFIPLFVSDVFATAKLSKPQTFIYIFIYI